MGKKKQKTQSTNTYGFQTPPPNQHFTDAANMIEGIDTMTPIRQQYGQIRRAIKESGNEFYGADVNPEVRDRVRSGRLFNAMQAEGRDLSAAAGNDIQAKIAAKMGVGGALAPILTQTGGTTNSQQWETGAYSPFGQLGMQALSQGVAM